MSAAPLSPPPAQDPLDDCNDLVDGVRDGGEGEQRHNVAGPQRQEEEGPVEHGRVDDGRTAVAVQRVDRIPLESDVAGCWDIASFFYFVAGAPMYFKLFAISNTLPTSMRLKRATEALTF